MGSEYNPNFVIQMIKNQDFDIIIDMMRFRDWHKALLAILGKRYGFPGSGRLQGFDMFDI